MDEGSTDDSVERLRTHEGIWLLHYEPPAEPSRHAATDPRPPAAASSSGLRRYMLRLRQPTTHGYHPVRPLNAPELPSPPNQSHQLPVQQGTPTNLLHSANIHQEPHPRSRYLYRPRSLTSIRSTRFCRSSPTRSRSEQRLSSAPNIFRTLPRSTGWSPNFSGHVLRSLSRYPT